MRLCNYLALTILFLSLCLTKGDDIKKTTVSWNPNDFLDELLQKNLHQDFIEMAKKYNLNMTFIYWDPANEQTKGDAIEIFYNNGQTDKEKTLDLKEFTTEDFEKLLKKAKDNGIEAYISQEKYNDDAVPVRAHFHAENQELDFNRNALHATFKSFRPVDVETISIMFDHKVMVYDLTYSNTGELENTLQYDMIQPTVNGIEEPKKPHLLFSIKLILKSLVRNADREHIAENLREQLDLTLKEYYWEVIVNPTNYYSSYDIKIALKVNDIEYHCLGRKTILVL